MKRNMKTIICHSLPSWDAPYSKSTVELMLHLDGDEDVLFLDYAYTWKDVFLSKHAPVKQILGVKNRLRYYNRKKQGVVKVLSLPPILPTNSIKLAWLSKRIERMNTLVLKTFIRKWMKKLSIKKPIVINAQNPVQGLSLSSVFDPSQLIYYSYDNMQEMDWISEKGIEAEALFTSKVDSIITTSNALSEKFKKTHPMVKTIHNGVNDAIFYERPTRLEDTTYIDYLGAVDNRLDFNLLQSVFKTFPMYVFRFVGPVKDKEYEQLLISNKNVRLLGAISQHDAAEVLASSSLCIIPFVSNDFTNYIYPLKINEYLSMGKPVVSTNFADLDQFKSIISITQSQEEFALAIQNELDANTPSKQDKRLNFASKNTWTHRSLELKEQLQTAS